MRDIILNDVWDFYYNPQKFEVGKSDLPALKEYSGKMVIPGYWDDHYELFDEEDFFGLTARFNPDYRKPHFPMGKSLTPHAASSFMVGSGYYRKEIELDLASDERAFLQIGPAMWGCAVYCNGKYAGNTTGYSVGSTYEITKLLKKGVNELIIIVCNRHDDGGAYHRLDKSHDGIPTGCRPGQHRGLAAQGYQSERGGIGGGVKIHVTQKSAFRDWFVSFENRKLHWHFELAGGERKRLEYQVRDGGNILDSGEVICDQRDVFDFECDVKLPELWSDENPKLYDFEATLYDAKNNLLDREVIKYGARTFTARNPQLLLNDVPTFLRGVTEHCYFPETTNPHFDKDKYLKDLGVLKKAGFNFIRCHTWCPPEPFYDACDELGFLVQTEFPSVYSFEEAEAIIRMIRRHSCAVILCEGNEKIIGEEAIIRLQKVVNMMKTLAPGMLFNPQEAIRGIEYQLQDGANIEMYPYPHDAEKLAKVSEFSDVYGGLCCSYFSYEHDDFPGTEKMEELLSAYKGKPCLSHEIGILGGYLDFDLEKRYEDTYIGTDLFVAARKNMQRHGVYQNWKKYYEYNTLFISALRKQLIENLRSCPSITGYDYLGGIDTHWHTIGYPCGLFNEFYEEKYGETTADILRYNNDSVLLCSMGKFRNYRANEAFSASLSLSHYGKESLKNCQVKWQLAIDGKVEAEKTIEIAEIANGQISKLTQIEFTVPNLTAGKKAILSAEVVTEKITVKNCWNLWFFPQVEAVANSAKMVDRLSADELAFMEQGGGVLLLNNFPGETLAETFRPHTSGRSLGHSGGFVNQHPVWEKFPHENFADWQFYELMTNSKSLVTDENMPEFKPLFELIPSFKMIRHKSLLAEYKVGKGRLIICGFNLNKNNAASEYLLYSILQYLDSGSYADAPEWDRIDLLQRVAVADGTAKKLGKKIDAGGRPIDD
ncbi:MAG: hypothetical protein IJW31_00825 [Lentisphaeria bacterium]|nr:hypothetical protein [Lentisphaeria bacterium]